MILTLLILWLWSPVISDCLGQPETIDHYEMQAQVAEPIDEWCDEGDGIFWCGGYDLTGWLFVGRTVGSETELEWESGDPGIGNIIFNRVVAVDASDNRGEGICP